MEVFGGSLGPGQHNSTKCFVILTIGYKTTHSPAASFSHFHRNHFGPVLFVFCSGHVFFSACWLIACYFRVLPSLLNFFFFFGNNSWSVNFGMRSCGFRIVYLSFLVFGLIVCLSFRGFSACIVAETTTKILVDSGSCACLCFVVRLVRSNCQLSPAIRRQGSKKALMGPTIVWSYWYGSGCTSIFGYLSGSSLGRKYEILWERFVMEPLMGLIEH